METLKNTLAKKTFRLRTNHKLRSLIDQHDFHAVYGEDRPGQLAKLSTQIKELEDSLRY